MSDVLLKIGESGRARKLLKTIGLPVPLPAALRRADGPWEARPLAGQTVALGSMTIAGSSDVSSRLQSIVVEAGAEVRALDGAGPAESLVFDATEAKAPEKLRELFDFFRPRLDSLAPSGRVVLLARPPLRDWTPEMAAAQSALEGFVRSLAKELGKSGQTAHLVRIGIGAEASLSPLLRFLLSRRSAFITGQVWSLQSAPEAAPPVVQVLSGRVALVTGAARGIGAATARCLAAEGARVVCLDRPQDAEAVGQLAAEIGGSNLLCDVRDAAAPGLIARALRARHGGLDIVVHNAGVTRDKTLKRMSAEQWDEVLAVNLSAVLRIDQAVSDLLREAGRVICLASIAGIAGTVGQTNYAAAKAGLLGYVRQRAGALASRRITVNAVAPGLIETRLTAAMPVFVREAGRRLSALAQGGEPRDVAEAITFLASPGAGGLNGSVLRVCGGAFLGA